MLTRDDNELMCRVGRGTAMGGSRARRLCPHAIVVAPRMAAYAEASRALYALFEDTTPSVDVFAFQYSHAPSTPMPPTSPSARIVPR